MASRCQEHIIPNKVNMVILTLKNDCCDVKASFTMVSILGKLAFRRKTFSLSTYFTSIPSYVIVPSVFRMHFRIVLFLNKF